MRRLEVWCCLIGLMSLLRVNAAEAAWQIPPAVAPTNAPRLSALLVDPAGRPVSTQREWSRERTRLRNQWLEVLGPLPRKRPPLKTQVLATEDLAGFTRQWVKYQAEDGLFIDGYLLSPKPTTGTRPAIVVFHPTTPLQARGVAGLAPEYPQEKWQGVQLVQRGYVVWCPRNYINTDGADWTGNAAQVLARHPDWTGMTRMVWDAIRAADFLGSLPNVDRKRLGCLGHSLGGKAVLYAMAFEERYRVGVSSEGGIGLTFSNWDAPWYLGRKIHIPGFSLENHQVLALVAPRSFLLLAGDSADGDRSWCFLEAARPVYALFGAEAEVGWLNHHLGHNYPAVARQAAEAFLDRVLKPDAP